MIFERPIQISDQGRRSFGFINKVELTNINITSGLPWRPVLEYLNKWNNNVLCK